tara:strand:- start:9483 stop:9773 length:291 start_codon:yes stop_codon:yes gene_type:complete
MHKTRESLDKQQEATISGIVTRLNLLGINTVDENTIESVNKEIIRLLATSYQHYYRPVLIAPMDDFKEGEKTSDECLDKVLELTSALKEYKNAFGF